MAWNIIQDFAKGNNISLPETLLHLECHLGNRYVCADWKPTINAELEALNALEALCAKATPESPPNKTTAAVCNKTPPPPAPAPIIPQLTTFKTDLMDSVTELHLQRWIVGMIGYSVLLCSPLQIPFISEYFGICLEMILQLFLIFTYLFKIS
jgi:hypothetical protein